MAKLGYHYTAQCCAKPMEGREWTGSSGFVTCALGEK